MRITALVFGKQAPMRRLTSGKHRLPRVVNIPQKREMLYRLAREEENLFYLRQPFMNQEQEQVLKMIAAEKENMEAEAIKLSKIKMRDHITFEDRLKHLKHNEPWE